MAGGESCLRVVIPAPSDLSGLGRRRLGQASCVIGAAAHVADGGFCVKHCEGVFECGCEDCAVDLVSNLFDLVLGRKPLI